MGQLLLARSARNDAVPDPGYENRLKLVVEGGRLDHADKQVPVIRGWSTRIGPHPTVNLHQQGIVGGRSHFAGGLYLPDHHVRRDAIS
jgi:hypothetical protein